MNKFLLLYREFSVLIKEHKLYFLLPLLFLTCITALFCFYYGPSILVSFIYAGI
jgi:hypothetical protein